MVTTTGRGENPLANIVVRPAYIAANECDEIVAALATRTPQELGTGANDAKMRQRVLETNVVPDDIVDVRAMIGALQARGSLITRLLAPVLTRHGAILAAVKQVADVPDAVAYDIFAALDEFVTNAQSLAAHRSLFDLRERNTQQLAYLQARGVFDATGRAAQLAMRWFHIGLLEELALPGAFEKTTRLFRRELDVRLPIDVTTLARVFERAADASLRVATAWKSARSGDYLDVLELVLAIFDEPAARTAALAALDRPTPASDSYDDNDEDACHALHVALGESFPAVFVAPRLVKGANKGRAVVSAFRNVQTVDWTDVRPRVEVHTQRFIDDIVLPYYGLVAHEVEESQLLRTAATGFARPHNDSERRRDENGRVEWVKVRKRDISLVFYLSASSDFDGGSLWFPELGIDVRPERGMAIAFPSDHRYSHCVREVTRGVRWAVSAWIDCKSCPPVGTVDQPFPWGR